MADERDEYREVYRSSREGLALLGDQLTEPERDAILREAIRTARKKENFWIAVALVGGPVVYLVFDAISSISRFKVIALIGYFAISFMMTTIKNHRSRIKLITKEVMAILNRKKIRPTQCIACESFLPDDGSPQCISCGCGLAEASRQIE